MNPMTTPGRINVAALVVAAVGTLVLYASVPDDFPPIPPGPIILLVAAAVVTFAPGRLTPAIRVIAPLFMFIGGIVTGAIPDILTDPDNVGSFVGSVIQMLGLLTAMVSGTLAMLTNPRPAGLQPRQAATSRDEASH